MQLPTETVAAVTLLVHIVVAAARLWALSVGGGGSSAWRGAAAAAAAAATAKAAVEAAGGGDRDGSCGFFVGAAGTAATAAAAAGIVSECFIQWFLSLLVASFFQARPTTYHNCCVLRSHCYYCAEGDLLLCWNSAVSGAADKGPISFVPPPVSVGCFFVSEGLNQNEND